MSACSSRLNVDLIYASGDGDVSKIKELVAKGAKVDSVELDGLTPLINAIQKDKIEAVRALLNAGANPNFQSGDLGPLFYALYYGRKGAAVALMDKGATLAVPNVVSAKFRDAVAPKAGDREFAALLARAGYVL
jgi:ankyrin repeat protein